MLRLLSYYIDEFTPMYAGNKGFTSIQDSSISKGDTANTSQWQLPNHLGTHIDLPNHFFDNGQTLEDFPIDFWMIDGNKIQVLEVELKNDYLIRPESITTKTINKKVECVLLKTGFGKYRDTKKYWRENPGISEELAYWLKETFDYIKILGIDSISISSYQHRPMGRKVHKILLDPNNPIILVEDMDLQFISKESLFNMFLISPMMVKKTNGCPCTIFADVK